MNKLIVGTFVVIGIFLAVFTVSNNTALALTDTERYNSGYSHGCSDGKIGSHSYLSGSGGAAAHTAAFMRGYNDAYRDCSGPIWACPLLLPTGICKSASSFLSILAANKITIVPGSSSDSNGKNFVPVILTISKGTKVTWINDDTTLHTVTSGTREGSNSGVLFDSSYVASGKTFQHSFYDKGTFNYYCTIHPFMKGKVVVTAGNSPPRAQTGPTNMTYG